MSEQLPNIEIPQSLLPWDGHFGSGPSKVPQEAVEALSDNADDIFGRSHRTSVVCDQVKRLQNGIRELLDVPEDYTIALGNGGATAFWEIAALGLIRSQSQHVIQGNFGQKWAEAVDHVPDLKDSHRSQSDDPRIAARPFIDYAVDAIAYTQNETAVGIKTDITRPNGEKLVLVDATSAAGAMEIEIKDTDAYFFSLQKAFAAEGGLWVSTLSPEALERNNRIIATGRYIPKILDLSAAVKIADAGQTLNTPSVSSVFLAAHQTEKMLENGGISYAAGLSNKMSDAVYDWADKSEYAEPFVTLPEDRSTTTPVVTLNGVDAGQIAKVLTANGIYDTAGYRGIKGANMLRFATFPAVEPRDIDSLLECVDYVADKLQSN